MKNQTSFSSKHQPQKNGRPKGSLTRSTCIRKALENLALDDNEQSIEEFCKFIKKTEPVEFFKALVKLAPSKIDLDTKGDFNLQVTFVDADNADKDIITIDNYNSR